MAMAQGAAPSYKYDADISQIPNCPPNACKRVDLVAYRFVYEDSKNKHKSYLPSRKISPKRRFKDDEEHCSFWALSLFETRAKAEAFFADFCTSHDGKKLLGTHLAEVKVSANHGVTSAIDDIGHMDFHEYNGTDLSTVAIVVRTL